MYSKNMDEQQTTGKEKKFQVILIIVLVLISISAIVWLTFPSGTTGQGSTGPVYTTTYSGISPSQCSELMSSTENPITIVDVRECKCNYNAGHITNAIWNINPRSFYNVTKDLLIYDNTGSLSIEFCESLIGYTYGAVYYLEGGIDAWRDANYPTVK